MVGVVRGILKDQITKGTKTSRVGVRNDAADRDLLHNLAKHLELGGTLVSIQQPIHVSVLDKFEESFARAHFFKPRSVHITPPRSQEIDDAQGLRSRLEVCTHPIEWEITLVPIGSQQRQGIAGAEKFLDDVRPKTNTRVSRFDEELLVH